MTGDVTDAGRGPVPLTAVPDGRSATGVASASTPPAPGLDELEDAELLRLHVAGDPHAFGLIVKRHRDRMWAVAIRTLGEPEEAADALQDAFI